MNKKIKNLFLAGALVLGLAGVAVSCTDYDDDINAANERIEALETGTIATLQSQVASLQSTVTSLQSAISTANSAIDALEASLDAVESKHAADIAALEAAYEAADDAIKADYQAKIDALEAAHANDVADINDDITALEASVEALTGRLDTIDETIKTLATKQEVDDLEAYANATFATKAAVDSVNLAIGTLEGTLEAALTRLTAVEATANKNADDIRTLSAAIETLEGEIANINTQLAALTTSVNAAQTAADKAQATADSAKVAASTALGNIASLKAALGVYAEQGKLEATIAALQKTDSTYMKKISDLEETKLAIADFNEYFNDALDEALAADGKITEAIATAVSSAKSELQGKIDALEESLTTAFQQALGIIADRLTSIATVPEYYLDGVPAIVFESLAYNPMADGENAVVETEATLNDYEEFAAVPTIAKYRLNPKTVGIDCAEFSFVGDKATLLTRAATDAPISIIAKEYDATTGYAEFTVQKDKQLDTDGPEVDIVALKAVLTQGLTEEEAAATEKPEVYSEYSVLYERYIEADDLAISDADSLAAKKNHEYVKTFDKAKNLAKGSVGFYEMPYNEVFDLDTLVATCLYDGNKHGALNLEKYGLTYRYAVASSKYEIASGNTVTEQNEKIVCTDAENGLFETAKYEGEYNQESIGRTPIVKIELMHGENVVTRAFVKLLITIGQKEQPIVLDKKDTVDFVYTCANVKDTLEFDEKYLQDNLYKPFNMSHVTFWSHYEFASSSVTKDGKTWTMAGPELIDGYDNQGTATKKVVWAYDSSDFGQILTTGSNFVATLVLNNVDPTYNSGPETITFIFRLRVTLPNFTATAVPKDIYWNSDTTRVRVNVSVPASKDDVAANCQFSTPIFLQPFVTPITVKAGVEDMTCYSGELDLLTLYNGDKELPLSDAAYQGVKLVPSATTAGEINIELVKNNDKVKEYLNSDAGLQALLGYVITLNEGTKLLVYRYGVEFIRPLNFNLPNANELQDAVTGGSIVSFQHNAILTDWRGEAVIPWETVLVDTVATAWVRTDKQPNTWISSSYNKPDQNTRVSLTTQEDTIKVGETYYEATATLSYNTGFANFFDTYGYVPSQSIVAADGKTVVPSGNTTWRTDRPSTGVGRTPAEAAQNAEIALIARFGAYVYELYTNNVSYDGRWISGIEVSEKKATDDIIYDIVSDVKMEYNTYTAVEGGAGTEVIPAAPADPGTVGDVSTDGFWTYAEINPGQKEQLVVGQYADFYGPISDVILDCDKATTSLEALNYQLPADVTLEQIGNSVKYVNVGSPIGYAYYIYIPATVTYGWGTFTGTLTLKVNPVGTVQGGGE